MRIFGFLLLVVLGAANLVKLSPYSVDLSLTIYYTVKLLKRRLPPRNVGGHIFSLEPFRSASYSVYCLSGFVTFLGIYTCQCTAFHH